MHLEIAHREIEILEAGTDMAELPRRITRMDHEIEMALLRHPRVEAREHAERREHEPRREQGSHIQARADREPHARDDPETRRRREPRDRQPLLHDRPGAEEADA